MLPIFYAPWDVVIMKIISKWLRAEYKGNCIIKQEIVHDKEEINQ